MSVKMELFLIMCYYD